MLRSTPIFRGCKSLLGKARPCRAHSLAAEGSAGVPAIIIWCRIGREEERERAERHKTIILLRLSTGAQARPRGPGPSGQRRGSGRAVNGLFSLALSERNKIKILLRSVLICDIMDTGMMMFCDQSCRRACKTAHNHIGRCIFRMLLRTNHSWIRGSINGGKICRNIWIVRKYCGTF